MDPSEAVIQKTFVGHLRQYGGEQILSFSIPNESKRSMRYGAELKALGLRPGAADMGFMWAPRGRCFLEFKSRAGQQTKEQKKFEEDCFAIGVHYEICRSWEAAWLALQSCGAPLARHLLIEPSGTARFILPPPHHSEQVGRTTSFTEHETGAGEAVTIPCRGVVT